VTGVTLPAWIAPRVLSSDGTLWSFRFAEKSTWLSPRVEGGSQGEDALKS